MESKERMESKEIKQKLSRERKNDSYREKERIKAKQGKKERMETNERKKKLRKEE